MKECITAQVFLPLRKKERRLKKISNINERKNERKKEWIHKWNQWSSNIKGKLSWKKEWKKECITAQVLLPLRKIDRTHKNIHKNK